MSVNFDQDVERKFNSFMTETIHSNFLYRINRYYARYVFNYLRSEQSAFRGYEQELVLLLEHLLKEFGRNLKIENGEIQSFSLPNNELSEKTVFIPTVDIVDLPEIKMTVDVEPDHPKINFWIEKYSDICGRMLTRETEEDIAYPEIYLFWFSLPELTLTQKLDVLHLFLCGVHSSLRKCSESKYVIYLVNRKRDDLVLSSLDKDDFLERILKAQHEDPELEKRWLEENPPYSLRFEVVSVSKKTKKHEEIESSFSLRQKVLLYLVRKHRRLDEPETITREQLARNIAEETGDKISSIKDVQKNKLAAKVGSQKSAKFLATDLRAIYLELKKLHDKKGCEMVKEEILFLGEDVTDIKNAC